MDGSPVDYLPCLVFSPKCDVVMIQAPQASRRSGPLVISVLAVLLLILHQDYWFWSNKTLVFGILPMGLFWHICISIAATLTWYLATQIAWPLDSRVATGAGESGDGTSESAAREETR